MGSEQHRSADQRTGFAYVHEFELADRQLLTHGGEVDGLTPGHPARPGGDCQEMQHVELSGGGDSGKTIGKNLKCMGRQGIADQKGGRLVKLDVAGRLAATQDVVVHARQVVMYQRIGMDQFDGDGWGVNYAGIRFKKRGSGMA